MGAGIAAMHYIGMAAMRLPAMCHYSPRLVMLSVAVAVAISFVAHFLAFDFRKEITGDGWKKTLTGLVMGGAIPVMHCTGMAAASFTSQPNIEGSMSHAVSISSLGIVVIVIVTLFALGTVILTSLVDRRFSVQAHKLESSEQRYRLIVDMAFDAFVGIDSLGTIVDCNSRAEIMFGWKRSELRGKSLADLLECRQGGELLEVRDFLAPFANTCSLDPVDTVARNRQGREFPVELAMSSAHSEETPICPFKWTK